MRRSFIALVIVILAFCPSLIAQNNLDNDSVIKLVKAGLSDDLIVSTISASPGTYDTSANGLISLKTAGASDKVLTAIVMKAAAPAVQAQPPIPPLPPMPGVAPAINGPSSGDPDDPGAPHEAGIYVYNESAPTGSKMIMLEPSIYTQGKTGGMFASAMTYGIAKVKVKAVIRGAHSNTRVNLEKPVFYFYFEQQGAGLSYGSTFGGTSTPNEYTLLKFDVKGQTRETLTASANAFGASGGTDDKAITGFTFARLRPGVYKVLLTAPLQAGEYGFVVTAYSRVFDFGKD
jgi:hypothetical protein